MKKALLALGVALSLIFGQGASFATAADINGEEIRAFDFGFSGAPEGDREAGPYSFVFTNTDPTGVHVILFVRLASAHTGASDAEIIAALDGGPGSVCPSGCFFDQFAGGAFSPAGATTNGFAQLLVGRYVYFCPVHEGPTPHYKLGMLGTFRAK